MLNFAEQTGSGAVIVVWSFLAVRVAFVLVTGMQIQAPTTQRPNDNFKLCHTMVCVLTVGLLHWLHLRELGAENPAVALAELRHWDSSHPTAGPLACRWCFAMHCQ